MPHLTLTLNLTLTLTLTLTLILTPPPLAEPRDLSDRLWLLTEMDLALQSDHPCVLSRLKEVCGVGGHLYIYMCVYVYTCVDALICVCVGCQRRPNCCSG